MSKPSEPELPSVVLEVTPHPCKAECAESWMDPSHASRPFLVKVRLNEAAKAACLLKTGQIPGDVYACVNVRCGALLKGLQSLAPLQELVR